MTTLPAAASPEHSLKTVTSAEVEWGWGQVTGGVAALDHRLMAATLWGNAVKHLCPVFLKIP